MEKILQSKRFVPLLVTQFFGAFNDNLFKNMLLTLVTIKMTAQADILSNIIAGLFILPFFLFSATAGQLADKYDRDKIARILKITELVLMFFIGIVFYSKSIVLLIILLALMGTQSAFFGPIKYALLPQLLKQNELIAGNAYVEASTYIAILLGLILGTLLPIEWAVSVLIVCAVIGLVASYLIPKAPAPQPNLKVSKNIFAATRDTLQLIYKTPVLFKSVLGATWFWSVGALIVVQVYPLAGQILNTSAGVITFFLILFSVGVGVGSLTCNKLLGGLIQTIYVPISALGMGIALFVLHGATSNYPTPETTVSFLQFFGQPNALVISGALFFLAFCGGMYIVPLNALMQSKAPKSCVASVIAGNNILNSFGMAMIAVLATVLLVCGFTIPQLFLFTGIASVLVFGYICALLPDAFARSIMRSILRLFFRVKVENLPQFKKAGQRVLIVANHTSLLDAILMAAFMPEKITFAINTEWAKKWFIRPMSLLVDLYPLDPTNPMALRSLIEEVKKNKKVMIFPEGRITVTGSLMKIYEGAGVIAEKADAKVLPVRIAGAQYSKFSYMKNKLKTKFFPQITMTILPPQKFHIPDGVFGRERRHVISNQLYDLMVDMMYVTAHTDEHIFTSLLHAKSIHGSKHKIVEDIARKPLSYGKFIRKSYLLGTAYEHAFTDEKYIGILLPNTLANIVSFYALQSIDKTPAMINFSQGVGQVLSCIRTVQIKTILTARKFIEQAHLEKLEEALLNAGVNLVYLEDFATQIPFTVKVKGLVRSFIQPKPKHDANQTAVVLFTSGSEGAPKAVLLTHKNLQANRYQVSSVLSFHSADVFFNALPMFHSFGLSVGSILTTLSGVKTFFYPSPLHYRIVPELVYDTNATIICGTDTFFAGYGRMGHPYDFFNIKYAVVGGEKLKDTTNALWMTKFGVRILEGYGATETSPVLCINTPMYLKKGSVGRLLPRIESKLEPVAGVTEGGRLWVRGDNVMQGYMKADKPGKIQPPKNKWYDTGDIVTMDNDGFVSIQGRAKRFAKIAGEMVSLTSVEHALENMYVGFIQGILTEPDEKKGEQLVLITNNDKAKVTDIRAKFKKIGFSELWVPKRIIYVKNPPILGTGKFDYQSAKALLEK